MPRDTSEAAQSNKTLLPTVIFLAASRLLRLALQDSPASPVLRFAAFFGASPGESPAAASPWLQVETRLPTLYPQGGNARPRAWGGQGRCPRAQLPLVSEED
ncbi:G-protein coupled receptor 15 [Platysternon megacephalum]|uniref:G-protein coupled receptor 15 n=1 Tax=Platysternon megacephalum TaxID=55544 RepID=A0A4D9EE86_9SAUR|nr:G-protein coupled receptor 15 [Platysternon megacephalum]